MYLKVTQCGTFLDQSAAFVSHGNGTNEKEGRRGWGSSLLHTWPRCNVVRSAECVNISLRREVRPHGGFSMRPKKAENSINTVEEVGRPMPASVLFHAYFVQGPV